MSAKQWHLKTGRRTRGREGGRARTQRAVCPSACLSRACRAAADKQGRSCPCTVGHPRTGRARLHKAVRFGRRLLAVEVVPCRIRVKVRDDGPQKCQIQCLRGVKKPPRGEAGDARSGSTSMPVCRVLARVCDSDRWYGCVCGVSPVRPRVWGLSWAFFEWRLFGGPLIRRDRGDQ